MKQKFIDPKKDNQISDNESTLENETWGGNQGPQENGSGPEMNELQEEIVKLQDQLQEKDAVVEEYLSMLQQLQAEFQNYKKRVERERSAVIEQANGLVGLAALYRSGVGSLSVSQKRLMNQLARPRNGAAHQGQPPSPGETSAALRTARTLVEETTPLCFP